jgi:hypothetical protein
MAIKNVKTQYIIDSKSSRKVCTSERKSHNLFVDNFQTKVAHIVKLVVYQSFKAFINKIHLIIYQPTL